MEAITVLDCMIGIIIFGFVIAFFIGPTGYIPGTAAWKDRVYCQGEGLRYAGNHLCWYTVDLISGTRKNVYVSIPEK